MSELCTSLFQGFKFLLPTCTSNKRAHLSNQKKACSNRAAQRSPSKSSKVFKHLSYLAWQHETTWDMHRHVCKDRGRAWSSWCCCCSSWATVKLRNTLVMHGYDFYMSCVYRPTIALCCYALPCEYARDWQGIVRGPCWRLSSALVAWQWTRWNYQVRRWPPHRCHLHMFTLSHTCATMCNNVCDVQRVLWIVDQISTDNSTPTLPHAHGLVVLADNRSERDNYGRRMVQY